MLIDGQWCAEINGTSDCRQLKLGEVFLAEVIRGSGDLAEYWVAFLNGQKIGAHKDQEWAMACAEQEICKRVHNIRHHFLLIKQRAPTSSDLYPYGAWERFKAARARGGGIER